LPYTTYAIGDVHGRADLLESLLEAISQKSVTDPRVLFLGDIVDRGPRSREAMDLVFHTLKKWPRSRLIRGNHDAYFLDFMTAEVVEQERFTKWLMRLGGYETLESYSLHSAGSLAEVAASVRADYPHHLQVLREAAPIVIDDWFAYAHAGIDPLRPVGDQDAKDLMMIRDRFLRHDGPLSHIIVHGHTRTQDSQPESRPFRIGIDTGAYASGRLTCLAVSADERNLHFLFATGGDGCVSITRERLSHDRFPQLKGEIS
jgi:serine/threonine protein phosphatase 1